MTLTQKLWFAYGESTDDKSTHEIGCLFDKLRKSLTSDEQLSLLLDYAVAISANAYDREKAAFFHAFSLGRALALEVQNPDAEREDC